MDYETCCDEIQRLGHDIGSIVSQLSQKKLECYNEDIASYEEYLSWKKKAVCALKYKEQELLKIKGHKKRLIENKLFQFVELFEKINDDDRLIFLLGKLFSIIVTQAKQVPLDEEAQAIILTVKKLLEEKNYAQTKEASLY